MKDFAAAMEALKPGEKYQGLPATEAHYKDPSIFKWEGSGKPPTWAALEAVDTDKIAARVSHKKEIRRLRRINLEDAACADADAAIDAAPDVAAIKAVPPPG